MMATALPHSCACGVRWAGDNTAHCSTCHLTFSGPWSFDRHRRDGQCRPPAEVGFVLIERVGYTVYGAPSDDTSPWRADRGSRGQEGPGTLPLRAVDGLEPSDGCTPTRNPEDPL